MQQNRSRSMRHAVALVALVTTLGVGCKDDGTPTVTVDEDNVEVLALAAAEASVQGVFAHYALFKLADPIFSAAPATAGRPSAGGAALCISGSLDVDEGPDSATITFNDCAFNPLECTVNGVLEADLTTIDDAGGLELRSRNLVLECGGTEFAFDKDRVACPTPFFEYEDCKIELGPFTGRGSDKTIRVPELELFGVPWEIASAATGRAVASGLGSFEFYPNDELEIGCDGLPNYGLIVFYGEPPSAGSVAFDDEDCIEYEVCYFADTGGSAEPTCDMVPYPGAVPE